MVKRKHVYSPKGGVGKTTTAINLAGYFANVEKKRVCVVDLDSQHTASDIYQGNLCGFDVRTQEPSPREGYEILIFDHHPTHDKIKLDGQVICPIRPSRVDFESYRRGRAIIGDTPHILVINQWSANGGSDKEFIKMMKKQCNTNNIPCSTIKARSIYKRCTDNAQTIFNVKPTLYGVSGAKTDIYNLVDLIK